MRPDRRDPRREPLRRLVLAGNMMAAQLTLTAEALDESSGPQPDCMERRLAELWEQMLDVFIADLHIGPPPARFGANMFQPLPASLVQPRRKS